MTFNISNLINVLVLGIGGLWFLWRLEGKLSLLIQETTLRHQNNIEKFVVIDQKLNELVHTTVELAKVEARMNQIDIRIQELSNRIIYNARRKPKV